MTKKNHIPSRMCAGCNQMKEKKELIRLVRTFNPDGKKVISIDFTFKAPGRGMYLCKDADCLRKLRKNKRIEKTISSKVDESFYEELERIDNDK